MATARSSPAPEPSTDDGFNETQKSQLADMIAAAVGGAKPPEPDKSQLPKLSDDEWDALTDRGKESWVRKLVDGELDRLFKDDEQRRLAADVEALKAGAGKPEPEKTPAGPTNSFTAKLQKLLWGDRDPS
jgi:hypothetical protein